MKRKTALLFACLLLVCSVSGCNKSDSKDTSKTESVVSVSETSDNSKSEISAQKDSETSSDSTSKTESRSETESKSASEDEQNDDESEDVIEASFDEDGNLVFDIGDPDDWEEDSESEFEDEDPEDVSEAEGDDFISSYTLLMLSPEDFKSKESLPVKYIITSEAELSDFIENHSADYALKVEYTGDSFIEKQSFEKRAADTIKNDLPVYDYLLIITDHSKSVEPDVGSGMVNGNSVVVDLWITKPSSDADKAYSCLMIPVEKGFLNGKDLSVINVDPPVEEDEDEDNQ